MHPTFVFTNHKGGVGKSTSATNAAFGIAGMLRIAGAPYRLADPLSQILNRYAAIVIDTSPSFSLMTEMGLIAATDAIVPVEPRYLETVGLMSVIGKISDIHEG